MKYVPYHLGSGTNRRHHRTLGNLPPRVINKSKHEIIITRGGFVRQNAGSTTVNTILPRAVALHTHKQYCIHIVYDMGVWCVNFPTPRFFAKPDNGRRGAGRSSERAYKAVGGSAPTAHTYTPSWVARADTIHAATPRSGRVQKNIRAFSHGSWPGPRVG